MTSLSPLAQHSNMEDLNDEIPEGEWVRHQLILPDDDYDEDDEIDALIERNKRRNQNRVERGNGIFGV